MYEPNVLGSSDFITGKPGSCSRKLGFENCYTRVDYRGIPVRVIRIRYGEKDGQQTKTTGLAGTGGRGGVISNTLVYALPVWVFYSLIEIMRKKSQLKV